MIKEFNNDAFILISDRKGRTDCDDSDFIRKLIKRRCVSTENEARLINLNSINEIHIDSYVDKYNKDDGYTLLIEFTNGTYISVCRTRYKEALIMLIEKIGKNRISDIYEMLRCNEEFIELGIKTTNIKQGEAYE